MLHKLQSNCRSVDVWDGDVGERRGGTFWITMRFLFAVAKKPTYINLKSMWTTWIHSASNYRLTLSHTFSLVDILSINPARLLRQSLHCKQSTLSQTSSSPAVCLSIAHCLLRCNSRMSQLPALASSPLFGSSAECFNCPRAGGWISLQHAQSAANKPKLCSCQDMLFNKGLVQTFP